MRAEASFSDEFLARFDLSLSEEYISSAWIISILLGIFGMALLIFNAISVKRARPLGIIAAVFQPIGMIAAVKYVICYANIDFSKMVVHATGSSASDAMSKAKDQLMENWLEAILPQMIEWMLWAVVLTAAVVVTAVYAIMMFKTRTKVLAIFAFVFLVMRFLAIVPLNLFGIILGSSTEEAQALWDVVYRFFYLMPLLLLAVQGLLHMITQKKQAVAGAEVSQADVTESDATETNAAEGADTTEATAAPAQDKGSVSEEEHAE